MHENINTHICTCVYIHVSVCVCRLLICTPPKLLRPRSHTRRMTKRTTFTRDPKFSNKNKDIANCTVVALFSFDTFIPKRLIMFLYDLPIVATSCVTQAIIGNFTGTSTKSSSQEVAVIRGTSEIELLRPDVTTGKLISIHRQPTFSILRSIQPFRLMGQTKGIPSANR